MDVFALRDSLIHDYRAYVSGFINIRDERIRSHVEKELSEGLLWPEPLIQLNPAFEPGASIDEFVDEGVLEEQCRRIFRFKADAHDVGRPLRMHKHQDEAIRIARGGHNYVLTTGTGSGKSLAYIIPIVDTILRL
ncbi:MAG TPA: DEAD/DEAH box helicase, partial [Thermoleophilia bacterium]|nr:DEAD/DEAH box helicase [Thermoleophilia bacterium]